MKKKSLYSVVPIAALLLFSCTEAPVEVNSHQKDNNVQNESVEVLSSANILVDDEMAEMLAQSLGDGGIVTKSEVVNKAMDALGVKTIERLFPDTGRFDERHREFGLHKWYKITYNPDITPTKAAEIVSDVPGISAFEAERPIKLMDDLPFDDPYLSKQWHYYNNGSESSWKAGADINVLPVWKSYTTGSSDVIVAVVDGGLDFSHEDLSDAINKTDSWNFCNNSPKVSANNHGTHVGGTIGAINNNGLGVSGIAGGDAKAGIKGVQLLSCQIFSNNEGSGNGATAIVWAADHGAVICNNSWGYDFEKDDGTMDREEAEKMHNFFSQPNSGEYKSSVKDAIDYFNTYAGLDEDGNQVGPMAGGVVFFSAGNESWKYGPPANYEGAIAVGAFGPTGEKAYYTNFGTLSDDWVDIAAPGGDYNYSQIVSTLPGNAYGNMQGTSMACPHVSGVAALIVSAKGGPGFTREMLVDRLLNSPNPKINVSASKIGIPIDATGALTYGADPEVPADVTTLKAKASSNTITATWNVTESENGVSAFAYRLFYGTDRASVVNATAKNPVDGVSSIVIETGSTLSGEEISTEFIADFEKTYYLKVLGYDYQLNYSGNSNIATVTTPANAAPVITPDSDISNLVLKATGSLNLTLNIEDPDGHSVTVTHTPGSKAESFVNTSGSTYVLRIVAPEAEAGTYTSVITAKDSYGKSSTLNVKYTIKENQVPVAKAELPDMLFTNLGETREISLADYFNDPDEDELTYSVQNGATSVAHIVTSTGKMSATSLDYGLTNITITASDAKKATVSQSFKILVREAGVEAQAYPTTVTNSIFISTGETLQPTEIKIVSQTGNIFFDGTVECSAFEPAEINMTNAAPGKYVVIMTFSGKEYRQSIVKK